MEDDKDTTQTSATRPRWRTWVGVILIVLGCLITIPAVALKWGDKQLTQTDAYLDTVTPLIDDPAIQRAFATKITDAIMDQIDLEKFVDSGIDSLREAGLSERLSQGLRDLSSSIEGGIEGLINRQALKAVSSKWAHDLWVDVNTVVYEQLGPVLEGDANQVLQIRGDSLIADTGVLTEELKNRLAERGLGIANLLPTIHNEVTLVNSSKVATVQDSYQQITFWGTVLPWLAAALLVGGILLIPVRLWGAMVAGIGVSIAMLILAFATWVTTRTLPDAIPADIFPRAAASQAVQIILASLWRPIWFLAAVGIVVAAGAFLAGPNRSAEIVRQKIITVLGIARQAMTRRGWSLGQFGTWMQRLATALIVATVIIAALVLGFWDSPTWTVVVWTTAISALIIALVLFLAAPEDQPAKQAAKTRRRH